MALPIKSDERTPLLRAQTTAPGSRFGGTEILNPGLGGIDAISLARSMQTLSSQIGAGSALHHTMPSSKIIHTSASRALSESLSSVDPVIMRAIEILSAANQSQDPQQIAPPIEEPSIQQTLSFPDGHYEGEVQNGLPHGRGTMTYHPGMSLKRYDGEWKNGKFEGRGVLKFSNESRYEGQWVGGRLHGHGIQYLAGGEKYEGDFVRGKRHGKGTLRYADGNRYEGDWENDERHGYGKIQFYNGDVYEGEIKNNSLHGRGVYKHANGNKYVGEYKNGKRDGQGSFTGRDLHDVGIFKDGKLWTGKRNGISEIKEGVWKKTFIDYLFCCCGS